MYFINTLWKQVGVGEDIGVHQSTVPKVIWDVCQQIITTSEEFKKEMNIWKTNFKIPWAIGAIDSTHILSNKPTQYGNENVNRKNQKTCNVQ